METKIVFKFLWIILEVRFIDDKIKRSYIDDWSDLTCNQNNPVLTPDSLAFCPAASGVISDLIWIFKPDNAGHVRRNLKKCQALNKIVDMLLKYITDMFVF